MHARARVPGRGMCGAPLPVPQGQRCLGQFLMDLLCNELLIANAEKGVGRLYVTLQLNFLVLAFRMASTTR